MFTVTSPADSGPGSLRQAVNDAGAGDAIVLQVMGVISLVSGELAIQEDLTLIGPGAANLTIVRNSAASDFRIFRVLGGVVNLGGFSIANGRSVDDASRGGGGIRNQGTLSLSNVVVRDNLSFGGQGGGIANLGSLTMTLCTVSNNRAGPLLGGNGIYNSGSLVMRDCEVATNSMYAANAGGGVYNDSGGKCTVIGTRFWRNSSVQGGGAICNSGSLTSSNCVFLENSTAGGGGAIQSISTAKVLSCLFRTNLANSYIGGGIENEGSIQIRDCVFEGNTAARGGGVGEWEATANGTVSNCTFRANAANRGGGIYLNRGRLTVLGSLLSGNLGIDSGGGLTSDNGNITLATSMLLDNLADTGGGMHSNGRAIIDRSTISHNQAFNGHGGGIQCDSGDLDLINSTVSLNTAARDGGGIFRGSGTMVVSNCTVYANSAASAGGLKIGGSLGIFSSIVAGNTISNGITGRDILGTVTSLGYNLVQITNGCVFTGAVSNDLYGLESRLSNLQDNGGPTLTHSPMPTSPVIDAASSGTNGTDQRGHARGVRVTALITSLDDGTDIGAVELDNLIATLEREGNDLRLQFVGSSNHMYRAEFASSLPAPNWVALTNPVTGNHSRQTLIDAGGALHGPRYYRLRQE